MEYPLIQHPDGALDAVHRYRVLSIYVEAVGRYQLRDAVIDLGVYMIRASDEDYAAPPTLRHLT